MKRLAFLITLVVAALMPTGCTHNNGDIGPIFGTWVLREASCDGQRLDVESFLVTWSFQNNILSEMVTLPHNTTHETWATWGWGDEGRVLYVDFTHCWQIPQCKALGFPEDSKAAFTVKEFNKKTLSLVYIHENGSTYAYRFDKN